MVPWTLTYRGSTVPPIQMLNSFMLRFYTKHKNKNMSVPCLLYNIKIIKYLTLFLWGYSLDLREWFSNVRLLEFLTPQQYGTRIDNRQHPAKWSDPTHEVNWETDAKIVFHISDNVNPVLFFFFFFFFLLGWGLGESRRPYEFDSMKWESVNISRELQLKLVKMCKDGLETWQ